MSYQEKYTHEDYAMQRSYEYVLCKLKEASEKVSNAPTVQEGLLAAYIEDIQWLYDLDDYPINFLHRLIEFNDQLTTVKGRDSRDSVSATISRLDAGQATALAEKLSGLTGLLESAGAGPPAEEITESQSPSIAAD